MLKFSFLFSLALLLSFSFYSEGYAKQKLPASEIKCEASLDEMDDVLHDNYGGNFLLQDADDATANLCKLLEKTDRKCRYEFGSKGDLVSEVYYGDDHYCFMTETKDHSYKNAMLFLSSAVNMFSRDMSIIIGSASPLNKIVYTAIADDSRTLETAKYRLTKQNYKEVTKEEAEANGTYLVDIKRVLVLGKMTLESTYTQDYVDHVLRNEKHHPGESWMLRLKPTEMKND